jgi:hypothetical protein
MSPWTEWDGRAARRAVLVAIVSLVVAWLVTAATDEGNVAWTERAGRALPVAPVCAAIGAWAALAPARVRGELRALASLGRSPWQNARAAALGGAAVAIVAGAAIGGALGASRVDVAGFYPEIGGGDRILYTDGAFVDRVSGWRVDKDGSVTRAAAEAAVREERIPPYGRAAAGLATAICGLALALVVGKPERRAAWLAGAAVIGAAMLVSFQAAAARWIGAPWAVVPPLVLLAAAAARYIEAPWRTR